ncbi:DNA-processing protein DprA [Chondrinema litorale]|uniref:DNA-processing protein DprA n=1 Tax=Chondrinema litorale TaxID=2994555 RepID=UPI002542FE82|nr:DNA-processing protein DprA [Chondrinema litorale]UZR94886.1 DNA-processing protein DprA [Chondrinema litorale]
MEEENLFEIALGLVPGIGNVLAKHLISYRGSAKNVFQTPKGKLLKIPGIGPKIAEAILSTEVLKKAENELKQAQEKEVSILFYTSPTYPKRLKNILNAPILLYYKGAADLNSKKILSIVGTRKATEYGKNFIESLLKQLQSYPDLLVVSGLAYGIDICTHKVCLKNQIPTVGVMANGLDMVYPYEHKDVAKQMILNGGILTENRFGSKPDAPKFPERNRIIAGMSDAVLVVEAAESGGALITAEIANSYDIEVFALPGNVNQQYSKGCNKLIKEHKAHMITSAEDIIELLNWNKEASSTNKKLTIMLNQNEQIVYDLLKNNHLQIDELSYRSQISMSQIPSVLLEMELKGIIKVLPGQKYCIL